MNDAFGVGGVKGVGNVDGDVQEAVEIDGAATHEVLESLAVEKFHGDEGFAVLLADIVNSADVGMV